MQRNFTYATQLSNSNIFHPILHTTTVNPPFVKCHFDGVNHPPNTYHHSLLPPSVLNACVRMLSQGDEEDNLLHDQKGKKTQIPGWVLKVFTVFLALSSPNQRSGTEVLSPILLFLTRLPNLCVSFSQTHKINLIYYSFLKESAHFLTL